MPKQSHSKYKGGFITVNGRANNSVAYNHDYYESNKDKWAKFYNKKKKKKYGKIADWLGFDERDEMKEAKQKVKDNQEFQDYLRNPFQYVWDRTNGNVHRDADAENAYRNFDYESKYDELHEAWKEETKLKREAEKAVNRYYDTPIGKIQGAYEDAKFEVEYFFENTIPDLFKRG